MERIKDVNVFFHGRKVGSMKLYKERLAAFEYDKEWLVDGFSISPFSICNLVVPNFNILIK